MASLVPQNPFLVVYDPGSLNVLNSAKAPVGIVVAILCHLQIRYMYH